MPRLIPGLIKERATHREILFFVDSRVRERTGSEFSIRTLKLHVCRSGDACTVKNLIQKRDADEMV